MPPPPPPPPLGGQPHAGPGAPPTTNGSGELGLGMLGCFCEHAGVGLGPPVPLPCSRPTVKVKKPIQTKFRMPVFNWVALKPSQIDGTVFTELNDEKVLQVRPRGHGGLGAGGSVWLAPKSLPQPHCRYPAFVTHAPALRPCWL